MPEPLAILPTPIVAKLNEIHVEIACLSEAWKRALRQGYRKSLTADVVVHGYDEASERRHAQVNEEFSDIVAIFRMFGASDNRDVRLTTMIGDLVEQLTSFPTTAVMNALKHNAGASFWDRYYPMICRHFEYTLGTNGFNVFKDSDVRRIDRLLIQAESDYTGLSYRHRKNIHMSTAHLKIAETLAKIRRYLIVDGGLAKLTSLAIEAVPFYSSSR
jgi:hypothetical protein